MLNQFSGGPGRAAMVLVPGLRFCNLSVAEELDGSISMVRLLVSVVVLHQYRLQDRQIVIPHLTTPG